MKKNYILWKRGWLMSLIEIGVPVLFLCLMFWFRSEIKKQNIPETSYLSNKQY